MPLIPSDHTDPYANEVIFFTGTNYTGTAYVANKSDQIDLLGSSAGTSGLNDKLFSAKLGAECQLLLSGGDFENEATQLVTSDIPSISFPGYGSGSGLSEIIVVNKDALNPACAGPSDDGFTFEGTTRCGRRVRVRMPC